MYITCIHVNMSKYLSIYLWNLYSATSR